MCGLELALGLLVMGVVCCVTIIGIPFGVQHFKFAGLALMPFWCTNSQDYILIKIKRGSCKMIVTTTNTIEGKEIISYEGIVFGEVIVK